MNDVTMGGMHADLAIDAQEWGKGLVEAQRGLADFAKEVSKQFAALEQTMKKIAVGLTVGISAPFAAMTIASGRGAAGFETAMNKVQAALKGINPAQLAELSKQARTLGPEVGRSAVDAAKGIETLGLAGMDTSEILGGGLAAALKLAAANAADLDASGALVTDVMSQFGIAASGLTPVVDKITGALDSSKLGFVDFQQAIAQAGGVAGSAGVSFDDFNTALAGTSTLFGSGSDAGTSFKTFITSLSPKSKEASRVMDELGISFFDASGKMKGLADISQILQDKLGNLSERSRTDALNAMFGSDGMRTAIGLMKLSKKGFEDLQATIAKGDAGAKLAIQMQGQEAAANRLSAAFESLKIAIGGTGLLAAYTAVTDAFGRFVNAIANTNPTLLKIGVAIWAVGAAIGPLSLAILAIAKIALPLFIGRFGLMGLGLTALINPIGAAAGLFLQLAIRLTGATSALSLFATGMLRFLGPIGLAVTAATLLYFWLNRQTVANAAARVAADRASAANLRQQDATMKLATATGAARNAIIAKARADRAAELQALATARADVIAARAALARAKEKVANARQEVTMSARGDLISPKFAPAVAAVKQAEADLLTRAQALSTTAKTVDGYTAIVNSGSGPAPIDMNFDKGGGAGAGASNATNKAADLARRREELKLQQQLDVATARGDIEEQDRVQKLIDLKRLEADYEEAGLKPALAKVAAAADMQELQAAITQARAEQLQREDESFDLRLAEMRDDRAIAETLQRKADLYERIQLWRKMGVGLAEAERRATEEMLSLDAARLEMRQRANEEAVRDRDLTLARLRADTDKQISEIERVTEVEKRARDIAERNGWNGNDGRAKVQAQTEVDQEEQARLQGTFRTTFRDGVRAALDGDLKGFIKNWWTERLTASLEDALNNVADMLFKLLQGSSGAGSGSGGGGLFGSILSGLGSIFGGGTGLPSIASATSTSLAALSAGLKMPAIGAIPGFKTGGEFEVGGRSGIDANLVQFRATKGEIVNIKRPGNDNGGGSIHVIPSKYFDVVVDRRAAGIAAPMAQQAAMSGSNGAQVALARKGGRAIP